MLTFRDNTNSRLKTGKGRLFQSGVIAPQLNLELFACPFAEILYRKTLKYAHIPAVFFPVFRQGFCAKFFKIYFAVLFRGQNG